MRGAVGWMCVVGLASGCLQSYDDHPDAEPSPPGDSQRYVVDRILLPTTATQVNQLGLNLDRDPQNRPDNKLGQVLSSLVARASALRPQASIDSHVDVGGIMPLIRVRELVPATFNGVTVWMYRADSASPSPCIDGDDVVCRQHLDGNGSFTVDPASPGDARMAGELVGGRITVDLGTVTIEIAITEGASEVLTLNLIGASMSVDVTGTGLGTASSPGKLGGALTRSELEDNVFPAVHQIILSTVERDCAPTGAAPPCGCAQDSTGQTMLDLFDELPAPDGDCAVTAEELRQDGAISSLFFPDVNMIDEDGNVNPIWDGAKDSTSLGIGFAAVGASYTQPPDPEEPPE